MEHIENMYIVKLFNGSVNNTGRFLAKGENHITYGASQHIYQNYQIIFSDLEQNRESKFAVVIDEQGTGTWQGTTFRNIQFISSSKEFCEEYKILLTRRDKLLFDRMDLIETKLELLRSIQAPSEIERINKEISVIEKELSVIEKRLEELNQKNFK